MVNETDLKISAAAFAVTTANVALSLAGYCAKTYTGHQYAQAGGKQLDEALDIINGPRGANIEDSVMEGYLHTSKHLVNFRDDVDQKTQSCIGSIVHWNKAREFYTEAMLFCKDTVSSSHHANINKSLEDLQIRKAAEQRAAWEQDEEQLQAQATRRCRHEDTIPTATLPRTFNESVHFRASAPDSLPRGRLPNPPRQLPAYPPVAYHSSNSTQ